MIGVTDIIEVTAEAFGVTVADIMGHSRRARVAHPRQAAYALAYEMTGQSLPAVGRAFGGRDHTTIMHGITAHDHRVRMDPVWAQASRAAREAAFKRVGSGVTFRTTRFHSIEFKHREFP